MMIENMPKCWDEVKNCRPPGSDMNPAPRHLSYSALWFKCAIESIKPGLYCCKHPDSPLMD
jgi:hypothetical protein